MNSQKNPLGRAFAVPSLLSLASLILASALGCGADQVSDRPAYPADGAPATQPDVDDAGTEEDGAEPPILPDGAPAPVHDAGAAKDSGVVDPPSTGIQIIVEPSDKAAALISAITNAKTSVHMTMYLFSSTAIMNALVAAKNKGREVKVLLNENFPANSGSNTTMMASLKNAGITVQYAPTNFTLTHEKCVIIDATTAWIMTMNATVTSPTANREYLAVDNDAADVAEAEAIFQADWADMSYQPTGKLVVSPTNAGTRLPALAATATSTIDMEAEELSDYNTVDALVARLDAGVKVRIVLANTTPTAAQSSAVTTLKAHKAQIVSLATPYIHAKAMVVDGKSTYVGSQNFTESSLDNNRELGLIFDTPSEVAKVSSTIGLDFAAGTAL